VVPVRVEAGVVERKSQVVVLDIQMEEVQVPPDPLDRVGQVELVGMPAEAAAAEVGMAVAAVAQMTTTAALMAVVVAEDLPMQIRHSLRTLHTQ